MSLRDRFVDPKSPDHRPRKAAYALPTLFTAGNIFLGYLSILHPPRHVRHRHRGRRSPIQPLR
jgi:hypothetical protein